MNRGTRAERKREKERGFYDVGEEGKEQMIEERSLVGRRRVLEIYLWMK